MWLIKIHTFSSFLPRVVEVPFPDPPGGYKAFPHEVYNPSSRFWVYPGPWRPPKVLHPGSFQPEGAAAPLWAPSCSSLYRLSPALLPWIIICAPCVHKCLLWSSTGFMTITNGWNLLVNETFQLSFVSTKHYNDHITADSSLNLVLPFLVNFSSWSW